MFSVITPVYNRADLIQNAVKSVLGQTCPDWELIIVDDGSEDELDKALAPFESNEKIKVIHQENGGVSRARNVGIAASRGDYIAFLDADDAWLPNHLTVLNELILAYPDAGFYGTWASVLFQNGTVRNKPAYFSGKPETEYFENYYKAYDEDKRVKLFQMSTSCIAKKAIDRVGVFQEGCKIGEDLDLTLRVAAYFPFVLTAATTAVYNHQESVATKESAFDVNWCFFDHAEIIYQDKAVPEDKKEHLKSLMTWFEMRRCRHLLLLGKREEARESYQKIKHVKRLKKDLLINRALLCMPVWAVQLIFKLRWRAQA